MLIQTSPSSFVCLLLLLLLLNVIKHFAARRLTDNESLFERGPGDVVPRRPSGGVDGPFVGPQQWRLRLGLAGGPFPWR